MARIETKLECVDCGTIFEDGYRCPDCDSTDVITVEEDEVPMNRKRKNFDDEGEK
jgi:hypothetical protein